MIIAARGDHSIQAVTAREEIFKLSLIKVPGCALVEVRLRPAASDSAIRTRSPPVTSPPESPGCAARAAALARWRILRRNSNDGSINFAHLDLCDGDEFHVSTHGRKVRIEIR